MSELVTCFLGIIGFLVCSVLGGVAIEAVQHYQSK